MSKKNKRPIPKNTTEAQDTEESEALWEYGPVDAFWIPSPSLKVNSLKNRLADLIHWIIVKKTKTQSPLDSEGISTIEFEPIP